MQWLGTDMQGDRVFFDYMIFHESLLFVYTAFDWCTKICHLLILCFIVKSHFLSFWYFSAIVELKKKLFSHRLLNAKALNWTNGIWMHLKWEYKFINVPFDDKKALHLVEDSQHVFRYVLSEVGLKLQVVDKKQKSILLFQSVECSLNQIHRYRCDHAIWYWNKDFNKVLLSDKCMMLS